MKSILRKVDLLKTMKKQIESVLEHQKQLINGNIFNSKKECLKRFNILLNQYKTILEMDIIKLERKIEKLNV